MLANVKFKKILKATVFKPLSILNKVVPKNDNIILLYSGNMGIRHNLKPVMEELIHEQYSEKYKIYCGVESKKYFGNEKEVQYVSKIKAFFIFLTAKHVFYSAGQIPIKPSKNQMVIHMNHGTSDLKAMGALSNIGNGDEFFFSYICVPSDLYKPIASREYLCPEENVMVCGEPMTDDLFNSNERYNLGEFDKILLWMPTFRQSTYLNYTDSSADLLPMFSMDDFSELNEKLALLNFKLIVKLHTAQDTFSLTKKLFSHLQILTNEEFIAAGYEIYKLMPQVDAFLGDYSSASLQFLLVDKPIAFVVPDMEEYRKNRGFCFEDPEYYMPGPLIKTKEELYDFFAKLKREEDDFSNDRSRVKNAVFKYQDGLNTKRVLKLSGITK